MNREYIDNAINQLERQLGNNTKVEVLGEKELILNFNNRRIRFDLILIKELRHHHIQELVRNLRENNPGRPTILIADKIFPKIKHALQELRLNYIEANGNAFIKEGDTFILLEGNKLIKEKKILGNRAFTKTGLKVLFHFLIDRNLINKTHREIAMVAQVGLGNIPQIITGLKDTNYILAANNRNQYIWQNKKELIDRWIEGYETTLRPTLKTRNYQTKTPWRQIHLNDKITVWGGEPAADLLTHYLRPEKLILYTNEDQAGLIRNYRLQPKKNGDLTVYEMFWNNKFNELTAPLLLVYTDLIHEGGKRNIETANKIYDEFISTNL